MTEAADTSGDRPWPAEHLCDLPETGFPGDTWLCPTCGTEWWADDGDFVDAMVEWRVV